MCGIAGFLGSVATGGAVDAKRVAHLMANTLRHRGPDAEGVWCDGSSVALAHRRLSILDLSPAGDQPMVSDGGRYVIVFNGEIYNHLDLRKQMRKEAWRGH